MEKIDVDMWKNLARAGQLPPFSERWLTIINWDKHESLAHWAARENLLENGYKEWWITNEDGKSVLDLVIESLPPDSHKWGMRVAINLERDTTVAHWAAARNRLPVGFKLWGLCDKIGETVMEIAAGNLPLDSPHWEAVIDSLCCETLAHWAATSGLLPKGFDRWELTDNRGLTVAHHAARARKLPEGFTRIDLIDREALRREREAEAEAKAYFERGELNRMMEAASNVAHGLISMSESLRALEKSSQVQMRELNNIIHYLAYLKNEMEKL
jgi:hypothetical protein